MKKILLITPYLFAFLTFYACSNEILPNEIEIESATSSLEAKKGKTDKVNICHYDADTDTWKTLNISGNALEAHLIHGDYEGECKTYTYVPDDNFERALIELGYDEYPLDDYVLTSNISSVTTLNVNSKNIFDLTGIEDFASLTDLRCGINHLTSLDVSQNTALIYLRCYTNQLTTLDITQNIALSWIVADNNQLTSLDVSQNIALTYLIFVNNQLTNIDISQNTALTTLECGRNKLISLDVSQNTALTNLYCYNNQLTSLDTGKITNLTLIDCINNQLTSLDISQNTALSGLICRNNQLINLNLKNGNNSNMTVDATNNPSLICVEVDNPTIFYPYGFKYPYFDHWNFSDDCGY